MFRVTAFDSRTCRHWPSQRSPVQVRTDMLMRLAARRFGSWDPGLLLAMVGGKGDGVQDLMSALIYVSFNDVKS